MYFKLSLQNGLQEGMVYAVEFSHRSGRDLINMAKKRTNVVPIIEDARHPHKYRLVRIKKYYNITLTCQLSNDQLINL